MAYAWMPGTRRIRARTDGGQMQGGAPRVVWLTLGVDPRAISVTSAAQRLIDEGRPCHLVWNPLTGDIAQLLPIVAAGRMLGTREHLSYDPGNPHPMPSVNREGRLCVQIGVLGLAKEPFTGYPILNHNDITKWLDSWHIPRRWPAGQPAPYRQTERPRSRGLWARGGHYGASQVPDTTSTGPGCIDIDQLIGTESVTLNGAMPAHPAAAISLSQRNGRQTRDVSAAVPLTAAGVLPSRLEPPPTGTATPPTGTATPGGLYAGRSPTFASASAGVTCEAWKRRTRVDGRVGVYHSGCRVAARGRCPARGFCPSALPAVPGVTQRLVMIVGCFNE